MKRKVKPGERLLGVRVSWPGEYSHQGVVHRGVVVYDGPETEDIPTYSTDTWMDDGSYDLLQNGLGRIRFQDVSGLIVRVDRSDRGGRELASWFYAPSRTQISVLSGKG